MRWALIKNSSVTNIINWDGHGGRYEDLITIEIPEGSNVSPGWLYIENAFVDPNVNPIPTKAESYDAELININTEYLKDTNAMALAYSRASLFDGQNEEMKKNAIYAQLQIRNEFYVSAIESLDQKYGE